MRIHAVLIIVSSVWFAIPSAAQNYNCSASASNPPLVRAEGLAESAGEVVFGCTGGPSGPMTTDFQLFENTTITSRATNSSGALEAVLLVNDPSPSAQVFCAAGTICPAGANVFQGARVASNSVTFSGKAFPE